MGRSPAGSEGKVNPENIGGAGEMRLTDLAHSAGAKWTTDFVGSEFAAGRKRHDYLPAGWNFQIAVRRPVCKEMTFPSGVQMAE